MERSFRFRHEVVTHPLQLARVASAAWLARRSRRRLRGAPATLLEELRLPQQAGGKRFASLVQLLEDGKGERLVRFAYATDGVARRGPVTLRLRDLERLRAALAKHPGLEEALRL